MEPNATQTVFSNVFLLVLAFIGMAIVVHLLAFFQWLVALSFEVGTAYWQKMKKKRITHKEQLS